MTQAEKACGTEADTNARIDLKLDGGYGWIVCCGTFVVNFVVFGIHNSFGVVYVYLLDDLKLGEIQTTWIGAMAIGLNFFFGPITSALCDRFGCRVISLAGAALSVLGLFVTSFIQEVYILYLTYGLVWGVGSSFSFVSSIVVLGQYFDRRLALANGIATSGSGVGSLVAGPVINYLQSVGWKNSMRILSGFANVLWVAALIFKPAKSNIDQGEGQKKLFDMSIWRNKVYALWVTTVALFQFGYLVPFVHLVKHAEDLGVPKSKGAWLIGFLSIASTLGRVVFGKLADLRFVNRLYLYQFSILSIGIATLLCPLASNYAGLVIYALVFGFFDGCFVGQLAVITTDVAGHKKMSQAVGNMYGTLAIPMSLGPPFAGWLHQGFGSYDEAFYASGAVAIFSCLLLFGVVYMRRKHSQSYDIDDREPICNCQTNDQNSSFECREGSPIEAGCNDAEVQLEPSGTYVNKKRCSVHSSTKITDILLVVERETVL